ncbi:DUF3096 domain-containing protein [Candidatus Pacearchaeota archaeon]|nr:DUF3096 domain-containing protein [Candidatus Pacearchaeota archaeon]
MVVTTSVTISAVLAIIVGIIILIWPKFLNIAVGIYLLIAGFLNLFSF